MEAELERLLAAEDVAGDLPSVPEHDLHPPASTIDHREVKRPKGEFLIRFRCLFCLVLNNLIYHRVKYS